MDRAALFILSSCFPNRARGCKMVLPTCVGSCCWPSAGATLSTWLFSYFPAHSSFGLFLQQTVLDFCTWQLNSFSANVEDLLRSRFWSPRMSLLPYSTGQSKSQGQPRFKEVQSYGKGSKVMFIGEWTQGGTIYWEPVLAVSRKA